MSQHSQSPPWHGTGIPSPGSPHPGWENPPSGISSCPSLLSAGGFEQPLTSTRSSDQAKAGALLLSAFPLLEGKQPLPQGLVQGLCRDIPSLQVWQAQHTCAPGMGQLEPGVTPGHWQQKSHKGK